MGAMMNILVLMIVWAIAMNVIGYQSTLVGIIEGNQNIVNAIASQFTLNIIALGILTASAGIIIGNWNWVYIVLFPIAALLIQWAIFPTSIFNSPGFPPELTTILNGLFNLLSIAFAILVISWWRGNEP